jgi:hypothetical protein
MIASTYNKVPASNRQAIETAMADLKAVLDQDEADAIRSRTEALAQASMKLGEAMYRSQQGGESWSSASTRRKAEEEETKRVKAEETLRAEAAMRQRIEEEVQKRIAEMRNKIETEFQLRVNKINRSHYEENSKTSRHIKDLEEQVVSLEAKIEGYKQISIDVDARRFGLLSEAIFISGRSLRPFVIQALYDYDKTTDKRMWWTEGVLNVLGEHDKKWLPPSGDKHNLTAHLDLLLCIRIMKENWKIFQVHVPPTYIRSMMKWIDELQSIRNEFWAHYKKDNFEHHDADYIVFRLGKVLEMADDKASKQIAALLDELAKLR